MDTNLPVGCSLGGCDVAAFASLEYVTALATDGWMDAAVLSRQRRLRGVHAEEGVTRQARKSVAWGSGRAGAPEAGR